MKFWLAWAGAVLLAAMVLVKGFAPSPIIDDSYVAVGDTKIDMSRLPGVFNGWAGNTIYIERRFILSRSACVMLEHRFNNEFGPIRIADTHACMHKGLTVRDTVVTIPLTLSPQLWNYETSVKYSWFRDADPMPSFRVCLLRPGEKRDVHGPCPTREVDLAAAP